jgi:hypothetical protein
MHVKLMGGRQGSTHFSFQSDILMPMMLFGNLFASLRQPSYVPPLM